MANSADLDQTAHNEQSELGLHCLPRNIICVQIFLVFMVCYEYIQSLLHLLWGNRNTEFSREQMENITLLHACFDFVMVPY